MVGDPVGSKEEIGRAFSSTAQSNALAKCEIHLFTPTVHVSFASHPAHRRRVDVSITTHDQLVYTRISRVRVVFARSARLVAPLGIPCQEQTSETEASSQRIMHAISRLQAERWQGGRQKSTPPRERATGEDADAASPVRLSSRLHQVVHAVPQTRRTCSLRTPALSNAPTLRTLTQNALSHATMTRWLVVPSAMHSAQGGGRGGRQGVEG